MLKYSLFSITFMFIGLAFSGRADTISESIPKGPKSPVYAGLDLQYSQAALPRYAFDQGNTTGKQSNGFEITLEWLPIQNMGRLGIGVGTRHHFFRDLSNGTSFRVVPLHALVSYHLAFTPDQLFVPFARFASGITWLSQKNGSNAGDHQAYGYEGTFGMEICLNKIDPFSAKQLDNFAGINRTFLVLSYSRSASWGEQPLDLTGDRYHAGLRFEM